MDSLTCFFIQFQLVDISFGASYMQSRINWTLYVLFTDFFGIKYIAYFMQCIFCLQGGYYSKYLYSWPNNSTAFGLVQLISPPILEWRLNLGRRAPAWTSNASVEQSVPLANNNPYNQFYSIGHGVGMLNNWQSLIELR